MARYSTNLLYLASLGNQKMYHTEENYIFCLFLPLGRRSGVDEFFFEEWGGKQTFSMTKNVFPGGTVIKTLCSHCRRQGSNPWSGN